MISATAPQMITDKTQRFVILNEVKNPLDNDAMERSEPPDGYFAALKMTQLEYAGHVRGKPSGLPPGREETIT